MQCPNCSYDNDVHARFCENCGRAMPRACPNCGETVSSAAKFCPNCGFSLQSSVSVKGPAAAPVLLGGQGAVEKLRRTAPDDLRERIQAHRGELEGERKLVTAAFVDIVGSTELAERLDPEDWRDIVSGVHHRISEAVHRYDGYIAQLLGDGVLAFFGAPLTHEDDAERSVRASLEIVAAIEKYANELRKRRLADNLRVRIGLNSGTVVVGNIGTDLRMEYLAIGDTVNLAARMQTAADPNSIFVSEHTQKLLGGLFELEDRGNITIKGKAEPVHVHCVVGLRPGAIRERGIAGLTSPLVGRDRELNTLRQVTEDLLAGRGAIVAIIAEAGIGKSRLAVEWRKSIAAARSPVRWADGRSLSYDTEVAYHLVSALLRSLLDLKPDLNQEDLAGRLRARCETLWGARWQDAYPYLAHLLGVPLEDDLAARVRYLDGAALLARYAGALRSLLTRLAADTPVVILADDVQWTDASSVELLSQLLPLAGSVPVVFACITRPDRDASGWRLVDAGREAPGVSSVELHLAPLAERDSQQLVDNLLNASRMPDELRRLVLDKTEGNPFYVEEVLRMLIDRGALARSNGAWVVSGEIRELNIPDTLQGVIRARIDRLPEEAKRTLQVAAVIGRRFQLKLLARVVEELNEEP